jgi:hypothetical protein
LSSAPGSGQTLVLLQQADLLELEVMMPDQNPAQPEVLSASCGETESVHETVCCFAEEFARKGYDGPKILRMFQNPFYAAAHGAYLALGHDATAAVIDKCLAGSGRARVFGEHS